MWCWTEQQSQTWLYYFPLRYSLFKIDPLASLLYVFPHMIESKGLDSVAKLMSLQLFYVVTLLVFLVAKWVLQQWVTEQQCIRINVASQAAFHFYSNLKKSRYHFWHLRRFLTLSHSLASFTTVMRIARSSALLQESHFWAADISPHSLSGELTACSVKGYQLQMAEDNKHDQTWGWVFWGSMS